MKAISDPQITYLILIPGTLSSPKHIYLILIPGAPLSSPEHLSLPRNTYLILFKVFVILTQKEIQQDLNPQPSAQLLTP